MDYRSLKLKIFIGIILCMGLGAVGIIYVVNRSYANTTKNLWEEKILATRRAFLNLSQNETRVLSASLQCLLDNQTISAAFLSHNREKLYATTSPLFNELRQRYSITHWYFIYPENADPKNARRCFLRVHDSTQYGDVIERATFQKAVQEKIFSSGIELGQTAFALRVVAPYYANKTLLGYMELGEEIDHFIDRMKDQNSSEYSLLVSKKYLDREDWKASRKSMGAEDDWNTMKDVVLVYSTSPDNSLIEFHGSIEDIPDEGMFLEHIKKGVRHYIRGVCPLYDATARKVGAIFILHDITSQYETLQKTRIQAISVVIFITLLFAGIVLYLQFSVLRRIDTMIEDAAKVVDEITL